MLAIAVFAAAAAPAAALGISVPAASVGSLKPGSTATSAAASIVITGLVTEAWTLRVDDPAGLSTDGHMLRSATCSLGVSSLSSRLHLAFSGGLVTTTIDRPAYDLDSLSNPVVAHGTTPDAFNVTFSQAVAASEALASGCATA
jgi:hypothetical protein